MQRASNTVTIYNMTVLNNVIDHVIALIRSELCSSLMPTNFKLGFYLDCSCSPIEVTIFWVVWVRDTAKNEW